jgi:hypothetical protein
MPFGRIHHFQTTKPADVPASLQLIMNQPNPDTSDKIGITSYSRIEAFHRAHGLHSPSPTDCGTFSDSEIALAMLRDIGRHVLTVSDLGNGPVYPHARDFFQTPFDEALGNAFVHTFADFYFSNIHDKEHAEKWVTELGETEIGEAMENAGCDLAKFVRNLVRELAYEITSDDLVEPSSETPLPNLE